MAHQRIDHQNNRLTKTLNTPPSLHNRSKAPLVVEDSSDDFYVSTAYGATDVGRKRESNQDQFLIARLNKSMLVSSTSLPLDTQSRLFGGEQGQLLLVADGMGGHAAGEKASSIAVDQLVRQLLNSVHWFFQVDHDCEEDFVDALKGLLQNAHKRILAESAANHAQQGMGTTLTMAHLMWPRMYVVHAGDSRCYLVRDGVAHQLTTDHTLAHQLVESGGLKPEEEATSRWSNVLWNVLGGQADGELLAEVRRADLQPGDTIVLCSDGLHRYVDKEKLAEMVDQWKEPQAICDRLIEFANDAGGEDNITVIVSTPDAQASSSEQAAVSKAVLSDDSVTTSIDDISGPFDTNGSTEETLPG